MIVTVKSLNKFVSTVGYLLDKCGIKWCFGFGSLLGLIRDDGVVPGDKDIDILVKYEDVVDIKFTKIFKPYQYVLSKYILNDRNRKPLYLSFQNDSQPTVDVFCLLLHNGIRYHTYDVANEKKEIPSQYVFKGIEEYYVNQIFKERFGTKQKPLLKRWSPIPAEYGSCLDTWYPDWKTPRKGESWSPYVVKMKSCKGWKDEHGIKKQLKKSREKYEADKAKLK